MKVIGQTPTASVTAKTKEAPSKPQSYQWWKAKSKEQRGSQAVVTANFLKQNQGFRQDKSSAYARLYGNQSLFGFSATTKISNNKSMPNDRPTFNLIQSAADTLISRITQSRPSPNFLTDAGNYKERNLAKKLNSFVQGEFYSTKAYDKTALIFKDALIFGTGCLKVYENDNRVALDRVFCTELFTDPNESFYGEPRCLYQVRLVDRQVLAANNEGNKAAVEGAETAYIDDSPDSNKSSSDQIIVVEAWHLASSKDSTDGRHIIATSAGTILDEEYTKPTFPFVFVHYAPPQAGFWGQGLAEQLTGTQVEINRTLFTISRSIQLVGVPRVFQEDGSKVVRSSHNNDIGVIVTYQGVKPSYEVAQCVPGEVYAQLERLIRFGFQQCGVSALDAGGQKPAGLNSGEAIRSYDDISTDRFASLAKRYDNLFVDLAYLVTDVAKDICEREGSYATIYPNKDGTKEIDLTKADLLKDQFVIQVFNMSSLPKDPAGRVQKVTEMVQSGMITLKEGRRLLDYPDLNQIEKLANASEERIYQMLDAIVEDGEYSPPDPFLDLSLAKDIVVQYYNLYVSAKLEEERAEMLRTFYTQVQALLMEASAPPPGLPAAPGAGDPSQASPQASPEAPPTNPLIPNAPGASQ